MFGAMTSLTGGGGLTSSESLGGDTTRVGGLNTTGMTFGAKQDNNQLLILGGIALLALFMMRRK